MGALPNQPRQQVTILAQPEPKHALSVGMKLGFIFIAIHLITLSIAFLLAADYSNLLNVGIFLIPDIPLLLLPQPDEGRLRFAHFFILGSIMWFCIPVVIDKIVTKLWPRISRAIRYLIILILIPVTLSVCLGLIGSAMVRSDIMEQRPELRKLGGKATSNFLTEKVVFEKTHIKAITGIKHGVFNTGTAEEFAFSDGWKVFFTDKQYKETTNLHVPNRQYTELEPLPYRNKPCWYMAYSYNKSFIALLDHTGKELWQRPSCGVVSGDMTGDGIAEFAACTDYNTSLKLYDIAGKELWNKSMDLFGHFEMADIDDDQKMEIIHTHFNSSISKMQFSFFNDKGEILKTLNIGTPYSNFTTIHWPDRNGKTHLLLVSINRMEVVTLDGQTIARLDAPGCRNEGKITAVNVKFKAGEQDYLAVRKSEFPLKVLYVYNPQGKLVYQKTDNSSDMEAALLATPGENGTEKLLTSTYDPKNMTDVIRILEYTAP